MANYYIFWILVIALFIGIGFLLSTLDYYARKKRERPEPILKGKKK